MYQVILTFDAETDIHQVIVFIERESGSKDAALKYLDKLESSIMSLEEFPEKGANPRYKILRNQRFKFLVVESQLVFYKIDEEKHQVVVYRVLHSKSYYKNFL